MAALRTTSMSADITMRTAEELGRLIAGGGVTARQVVEALLELLSQLERGESFQDLREATASGARPIDWSRFDFDRAYLARIPRVPGTYRFFDAEDKLLYVGKSNNLNRRIRSYFREGQTRSPRIQELLDRLHRIEFEHSGSELEAMLREAEQIQRRRRRVMPRKGLIIEPCFELVACVLPSQCRGSRRERLRSCACNPRVS